MREKNSPEIKKQVQAIEQIQYWAKRREQSELARSVTGSEVADSMIASYSAEMARIADENNLDLEKVLSGIETKDSIQEKTKKESLAKEALSDIKKLAAKYEKTKAVLLSSYDYHHQALMQGILNTIQEEVRGITEEYGIKDPELFKKFDLPNPEQVKEGHAKLDKLEAEKKLQEALILSGDKSSRDYFYEIKDRARKIIEQYKLNPEHIKRFEVPQPEEIAKTKDTAQARLSPSEEPALTAVNEKGGKITPDSNLHPTAGEPSPISFPEQKKEGWLSKTKRWGRKIITRVAFTAAALGNPKATTDLRVPPFENKKAPQENTVSAPQKTVPSKNTVVLKPGTIAKTQTTPKETSASEKPSFRPGHTQIKSIEPLAPKTIPTPAFESDNLKETAVDTVQIFNTPKADTEKNTESTTAFIQKDTIERVEPTAPRMIESKDTIKMENAKPRSMQELARAIDTAEKHAPQAKKNLLQETIAKIAPLSPTKVAASPSPFSLAKETKLPEGLVQKGETQSFSRDTLEKVNPQGLKTFPTPASETAPVKPRRMIDLIREIDSAEKHKPEVRKNNPARENIARIKPEALRTIAIPKPEISLALKAVGDLPRLPNVLLIDSNEVPEIDSMEMATTKTDTASTETAKTKEGKGKIKATLMDEKGNPIKIPRIFKMNKGADSLAEMTNSQPEAVTRQIYKKFKDNLKGRDYFDPHSYKPALQTIITMYDLEKIAGSWFMETKIQTPADMTEKNMNLSQGVFTTVGGTGLGQKNFLDLTTSELNHMELSLDNFSVGVIAFFHEYIHAWERSSVGMKDANEREAIAHYFSLFPGEFSSWRKANFRPLERDGTVSKTKEYPEILAAFPELDEHHQLMYASDFERYYGNLSEAKQKIYRQMHEKVRKVLEKIGIEKYYERETALAYFEAFPSELRRKMKEAEDTASTPSDTVRHNAVKNFMFYYEKLPEKKQESYKTMYQKMSELGEYLDNKDRSDVSPSRAGQQSISKR